MDATGWQASVRGPVGHRYRRSAARLATVPFALALPLIVAVDAAAAPPWANPALSPSARAQLLLAAMTRDEKIAMLRGSADQPTPVVTPPVDGHSYSLATGVNSSAMPGSTVKLGSCIDVPGAGSDNALLLQEYGCGNAVDSSKDAVNHG